MHGPGILTTADGNEYDGEYRDWAAVGYWRDNSRRHNHALNYGKK